MPAPVLMSLAIFAAPPASSNLAAAANASGRPAECAVSTRRVVSRGASVWQRARVPQLEKYCDLLSRAYAELGSNPERAETLAAQADKLLPDRAAPSAIRGRSAAAQGKNQDALKHFERAKKLDARSLEDPLAMHDFARALLAANRLQEALVLYRALVPRVALLPSTERGTRVLLEAAHASMRASASASTTKPEAKSADGVEAGLDEAVAYLREAKQRPPSALSADVALSLALALDRSGEASQADSALGAVSVGSRGKQGAGFDFAGSAGERSALEALALERSDRAAAQKAWEAYVAGGAALYGAAAQARLEALKRGAKPGAAAKPGRPAATRRGGGG